MESAIAACTGLLTLLVLKQMGALLTRRQRRLRERLKVAAGKGTGAGQGAGAGTAGEAKDSTVSPGGVNPVMSVARRRMKLAFIPALGSVVGGRYLGRIRVDLARAGIPLKPEELAGMASVMCVLGAGVGMLTPGRVLAAVALGAAGLLLPGAWVRSVKHRRARRLEAQMVDSLALMASSLRAGHSFMQALEVASRDMAAPLAPELARALKEVRLGLSLEEAFAGLVGRFESRDLELVVTGVLIQRQVGGNLAQVLDSISSTVEKRVRSRAKVRALTAQGRLSAWIVSSMPFGMGAVIFTLYPEFARPMLVNPIGVAMLAVSGAFLVVGILTIRKVVNIDV